MITDDQIRKMWRHAYRGESKGHIRSNCPSRAERKAIFDAIEQFWTTNRAALKSEIDTAAGRTLGINEARAYLNAWLKVRQE